MHQNHVGLAIFILSVLFLLISLLLMVLLIIMARSKRKYQLINEELNNLYKSELKKSKIEIQENLGLIPRCNRSKQSREKFSKICKPETVLPLNGII